MPLILTDFCISVTVSMWLFVGVCSQWLQLDFSQGGLMGHTHTFAVFLDQARGI